MIEANATDPYQIENPQFVFCIQPYNEGVAVWKDGAHRIEVGNHIVLYCEVGNLEANRPKRRTLSLFVGA
jgi:hypothetical protein